ncbi:MAG: GntR family transcriptional regulator [Erysipelotrichaceae bacterium]|nr:GntR family transcriptional regulator [Erysipelotrichaceae bacterium]MDD3808921.1 GntR family transcriptional regulator [Erysipelotrichaceae bacterium]
MAKYQDIADSIREKILIGEYKYSQKLPYERVLCVHYNCNKETMKRALGILVKEGLIVRRRGSGTFVKDYDATEAHKDFQAFHQNSFTKKYGAENVQTEVICFDVVRASDEVASRLQIRSGDFVYHLIRKRSLHHVPKTVEITYMPLSLFPNISMNDVQGSLYTYIDEKIGIKVQSGHKLITAGLSTPLEQEYLNVPKDQPVMQVEQVGYLENGSIFEYSISRQVCEDFELASVEIF